MRGELLTAPSAPVVVSPSGDRGEPPPCMTTWELRAWQAADAVLPQSERAGSPCVDCLPSWAVLRASEGRCTGQPGDVEE